MRVLQQQAAILLVDLSNFVARAIAIAQQDYLRLLLQMLLKLRRQHPHHRFVFALEGSGTLRRQQLLSRYKEGRVPSPEFNDARQLAIQMLHTIECSIIKAPDGEADDAIASYCQQHPQDSCIIVSNDRDLWQLINTNCTVRAAIKRNTIDVDRFACRRLLGVDPEAVPLMKALLGDASDNIPRGIARVHKQKLLRLVNATGGDIDLIPRLVEKADYLTENDKKKIMSSLGVVKQHLSVTRAWNNLNLKQKNRSGDTAALHEFLDQYQVQLNIEEIETIVRAS